MNINPNKEIVVIIVVTNVVKNVKSGCSIRYKEIDNKTIDRTNKCLCSYYNLPILSLFSSFIKFLRIPL